MDEALNNLLENVINHAEGATKASIQVDKKAISVIDNAPGAKALLSNLEGSGSGRFGLSIVKQIAEINGRRAPNHPYHFRVACATTADLVVTGVRKLTAGKPDGEAG